MLTGKCAYLIAVLMKINVFASNDALISLILFTANLFLQVQFYQFAVPTDRRTQKIEENVTGKNSANGTNKLTEIPKPDIEAKFPHQQQVLLRKNLVGLNFEIFKKERGKTTDEGTNKIQTEEATEATAETEAMPKTLTNDVQNGTSFQLSISSEKAYIPSKLHLNSKYEFRPVVQNI